MGTYRGLSFESSAEVGTPIGTPMVMVMMVMVTYGNHIVW